MLIYVLVRGWFLQAIVNFVEYGRNTHIRNILHICQVYFACRLSHIWSLEYILHFNLLVSRNEITIWTISVKTIFICLFLRC